MKFAVALALSLIAIASVQVQVQGQQPFEFNHEISFIPRFPEVRESAGYITIVLQANDTAPIEYNVTVEATPVTALNGTDFLGGRFLVVFPINVTMVSFNITIINDEEPPVEGQQFFEMDLPVLLRPPGVLQGPSSTVTILDDCETMCQNGGTLEDDCTCTCPAPYTGLSCESCTLMCQNGGTLDDDACRCSCPFGFGGPDCGNCTLMCLNGGTLGDMMMDGSGIPLVVDSCRCSCPFPFGGPDCGNCTLTCQNGGTLDDEACRCSCPFGFGGPDCGNCTRMCQNGGTLDPVSCTCSCVDGFTGPNCENCTRMCQNGGTLDPVSCTCSCVDGFTGPNCENCTRMCQNGGTLDPVSCTCSCVDGFSGPNCENCTRMCQNGGTLDPVSCTCSCVDGFTGPNCENCTRMCQNGGTLDVDSCRCSCPFGFGGPDCGNCTLMCLNGGTLGDMMMDGSGIPLVVDSCRCSCPFPFGGPDCGDCTLMCQNGGTLDNEACRCSCPFPFGGLDCGNCTRMCQNGGTLDPVSCTCSCVDGFTGPNCESPVTTIRCNDTIIGDPLYEVPVIIDEDGSKLSLCYEVLGGPNQNFNLISDTCVSVNALYSPMIIPSNGNFISKIGVLAEDNNGTCQQIEVDLEGCTARVGGQVVTMYNQNGVSVTRRTNRVRIAVPNCENTDLVMWVICEVRRGQPMIKFVVARGFSLRPTSHGLIGQFWNVEVEAERYNVTAEDKIPPNPRHYAVTVSAADGSTRRFFAWKSPRTWDLKSQMCLYSGDSQGGLLNEVTSLSDPVIQGTYDEYIVSGLFDPDYKYEMFTSQCN